MGRINDKNRNTEKEEEQRWESYSLGNLSIYIYSFLLGYDIKYLLRKAFFFREWKNYCVWVMSVDLP